MANRCEEKAFLHTQQVFFDCAIISGVCARPRSKIGAKWGAQFRSKSLFWTKATLDHFEPKQNYSIFIKRPFDM